VAANVNMPSDFPRHHRSTSPDRAEVLMVVLLPMRIRLAEPVTSAPAVV
jgi:hypothetical protein